MGSFRDANIFFKNVILSAYWNWAITFYLYFNIEIRNLHIRGINVIKLFVQPDINKKAFIEH